MLYLLLSVVHAQDAAPAVEEALPVVEEAVEALPTVDSVEAVVEAATLVAEAAQSGDWTALVALCLTIAIFVIRKFVWKSVKGKYLPYLSLGLAVIGEVSVALYAGADPLTAVLSGAALGLAAVGGWEFLKNLGVFKSPQEKGADEVIEAPAADVKD